MKTLTTQNSIYVLDEEHMRYQSVPRVDHLQEVLSKNLSYDGWHDMESWEILGDGTATIRYPDSSCNFDNKGCSGEHQIWTTKVESIVDDEEEQSNR